MCGQQAVNRLTNSLTAGERETDRLPLRQRHVTAREQILYATVGSRKPSSAARERGLKENTVQHL